MEITNSTIQDEMSHEDTEDQVERLINEGMNCRA